MIFLLSYIKNFTGSENERNFDTGFSVSWHLEWNLPQTERKY